MLALGLTKLMVIGEAKAIDVPLTGDGKGEVSATESILEPHTMPAPLGFQHHTFGDEESFCKERVTGGGRNIILGAGEITWR